MTAVAQGECGGMAVSVMSGLSFTRDGDNLVPIAVCGHGNGRYGPLGMRHIFARGGGSYIIPG